MITTASATPVKPVRRLTLKEQALYLLLGMGLGWAQVAATFAVDAARHPTPRVAEVRP